MEIIIGVIIFGGIDYFAYLILNKEKADGTHPLDSITKPVEEKKESKENNKSQPMVISWLDSPELEAKYEAYDERKKNEPENLQEKQKYLNDYNHEKSVAEI